MLGKNKGGGNGWNSVGVLTLWQEHISADPSLQGARHKNKRSHSRTRAVAVWATRCTVTLACARSFPYEVMLEVWVIFCCFFENLLVIYCTAITSIASKPGKRSCACCRNSIMSNVTQAGCQQRVHQANSVNLDEPLTLAEDLAETVDSNGKSCEQFGNHFAHS